MADKEKELEKQQAQKQSDETAEETGEIQELLEQLEEVQAKAAENMEGWQRAQAEFANYKKRQTRDQEQAFQDMRGRIIKRYLEVLDDLERALESRPAEGEGADWASGVELVYRKFLTFLESEGVTQMQALGEEFDPNLHEAIAQEESEEYDSGTVIEVVQAGYLLEERVLRPAIVKVAQ